MGRLSFSPSPRGGKEYSAKNAQVAGSCTEGLLPGGHIRMRFRRLLRLHDNKSAASCQQI